MLKSRSRNEFIIIFWKKYGFGWLYRDFVLHFRILLTDDWILHWATESENYIILTLFYDQNYVNLSNLKFHTVFICLKITQIQNYNSSLLHEDKLLWLIYIDCTLYTGIQYIKIFHFITPNFSPIPKHNFFSLLTQLLAFTDT